MILNFHSYFPVSPCGAMDQRIGLLIQRLWVRVPPGVQFFPFLFFFSNILLSTYSTTLFVIKVSFFQNKKNERNYKTEPLLLKATSIPGFSPIRPFERGCSESCMTSTSKRDAIRRLHALRNLNQLKQTILYSIPFYYYYYYYYYFARFCPRSINSFPVSSHFIGFSSIKNEFYIHSRVVFAVFDYLQK